MAAHLTLTDALADELANAVRAGIPIDTAAQAVGVTRQTIQQWLLSAETGTWQHGTPLSPAATKIIRAFADKVARARAQHQQDLIASIQQCAMTPNPKTGVPDWRAADVILSKHPAYRREWREERTLEVTQQGTVTHEHTMVKALSEQELEAAYLALPDTPENVIFSDPSEPNVTS